MTNLRFIISCRLESENVDVQRVKASTANALRTHPRQSHVAFDWQPAGDHDAVICRIGSIAGPDEDKQASTSSESEALETRHLREAGII